MTATFKPFRALTPITLGVCLLVLGGAAFIQAADKPARPTAEAEAAQAKRQEAQQRTIRVLEEQLAGQEQLLREKQREVDSLKAELQIPDTTLEPQTAGGRRWSHPLIDAKAEYQKLITLYNYVTNLPLAELRRAVIVSGTDQKFNLLMEQFSSAEEKLADLTKTLATDHPEVKQARRVLEQINLQINNRIDGILAELEVRVAAQKAGLEKLQAESEKARKVDAELAIKRCPYYEAKRELDSLQQTVEGLKLRLRQEKLAAALPPKP